jgi:hypothetical protein
MREPDDRWPPVARWRSRHDRLTHFDANGNAVMVDAGGKEVTARRP